MMIPGSGLGNNAIFKHFAVWEEHSLQALKPKTKPPSAQKKKNILAFARTDREFLVATSSPHHIISWSNDDVMHPFNAKYTIGNTKGMEKMNNWSPAEFISHVSRSVASLCAFLITRQLLSTAAEIMGKAKRNILGTTKVNVFA